MNSLLKKYSFIFEQDVNADVPVGVTDPEAIKIWQNPKALKATQRSIINQITPNLRNGQIIQYYTQNRPSNQTVDTNIPAGVTDPEAIKIWQNPEALKNSQRSFIKQISPDARNKQIIDYDVLNKGRGAVIDKITGTIDKQFIEKPIAYIDKIFQSPAGQEVQSYMSVIVADDGAPLFSPNSAIDFLVIKQIFSPSKLIDNLQQKSNVYRDTRKWWKPGFAEGIYIDAEKIQDEPELFNAYVDGVIRDITTTLLGPNGFSRYDKTNRINEGDYQTLLRTIERKYKPTVTQNVLNILKELSGQDLTKYAKKSFNVDELKAPYTALIDTYASKIASKASQQTTKKESNDMNNRFNNMLRAVYEKMILENEPGSRQKIAAPKFVKSTKKWDDPGGAFAPGGIFDPAETKKLLDDPKYADLPQDVKDQIAGMTSSGQGAVPGGAAFTNVIGAAGPSSSSDSFVPIGGGGGSSNVPGAGQSTDDQYDDKQKAKINDFNKKQKDERDKFYKSL